jgi:hypothetical protein
VGIAADLEGFLRLSLCPSGTAIVKSRALAPGIDRDLESRASSAALGKLKCVTDLVTCPQLGTGLGTHACI